MSTDSTVETATASANKTDPEVPQEVRHLTLFTVAPETALLA